jgi:hypothetical protein
MRKDIGRPASLSDPRRHCHPAGCPLLVASARASLSARSGRCRQYDSTALRWVGGIRGCLSACDKTQAGKDAERRLSSRSLAFWFFSSRQVDIPDQPARVNCRQGYTGNAHQGELGRMGFTKVRLSSNKRNTAFRLRRARSRRSECGGKILPAYGEG